MMLGLGPVELLWICPLFYVITWLCSRKGLKGRITTTSHGGPRRKKVDEGDVSQAYGQYGLAPVVGVMYGYPFTTLCCGLKAFLPISLTIDILAL